MGARLLGARYRLDEVVGAGGTGQVWRAHDTLLDRPVAVKELRPGQDQLMRERLRVEARLAGAVHHPGIAQVFDYGEEETDGVVAPYLVMQFVEGETLREVLRTRRTLPPEEAMDLVAQVAAALAAAHAVGIVHRDLKPGNILVTPERQAVLVDFGIARSPDLEPLTMTGTIVGTADYISPEQCHGQAAKPRSDLYSLGLIAYECLTGTKPLRRESELATVLAQLNDEVPPLDPSVPDGVRRLVHEMVAKDPDERPADAAEVARRASALAVGDEGTRPVMVPPASTRGRRRSAYVALAGAGAAAAVGALAFTAARPAPSPAPETSVPGTSISREATQDASVGATVRKRKSAAPTPSADPTSADPSPVARVEPQPKAKPAPEQAGPPAATGKGSDRSHDKGGGKGNGKGSDNGGGKGKKH